MPDAKKPLKPKHVPERQCMGCRCRKPKTMLIRVVRGADGTVFLDETHKKPGRGVYLCGLPECLKRVRKSRALDRCLSLKIPDEIYAAIEARIADAPPGEPSHG